MKDLEELKLSYFWNHTSERSWVRNRVKSPSCVYLRYSALEKGVSVKRVLSAGKTAALTNKHLRLYSTASQVELVEFTGRIGWILNSLPTQTILWGLYEYLYLALLHRKREAQLKRSKDEGGYELTLAFGIWKAFCPSLLSSSGVWSNFPQPYPQLLFRNQHPQAGWAFTEPRLLSP